MEPPSHSSRPDALLAARTDSPGESEAARSLWTAVGRLYHWRRFIVIFTAGAAVLSVVVSLLLPNWYKASSRVLLPESGGSGLLSAALGDLASAASSLFGGGGDYVRYLAILDSRSSLEQVVDSFKLVTVYELEDAEFPKEAAILELRSNAEFEIDRDYEYLAIQVWDKDPVRAAGMANYFVSILNDLNSKLRSQTASGFRRYAELRYDEALAQLDSVLDRTQAFQEEFGLYDISAQTESFFEQLAELRGRSVEAEIQYEVLLEQFGPDNARVKASANLLSVADRMYREALEGAESLLPVPQKDVPGVIREFVDLERERIIQTRILEVVTPILEQARFEERRSSEAVQIVDRAVPPAKKGRPMRSIICIVSTLTALILAVTYALLSSWWTDYHGTLARRFDDAVRAAEPGRPKAPES